VLSLVVPVHLDPVPSSLASLPEAASSPLPYQKTMTERTILRPIVPLFAAPTTNHAIRPLVRMLLCVIMTFVTSVNFLTAAESKPPKALRIMATPTATWKLRARRNS